MNQDNPCDFRPQRFFGLRIVAAAWLAQLFALGLSIGAYPVFIASIEAEFGASRTQTSLGIPLLMLAAALASPALGKWVDRGYPRVVMTLGAIIMSLGLWTLSWLDGLMQLTIAWIALVGLGQAMLGVLPANTLLANWFSRKRATMVAIAGSGIAMGSAIFPFIAEYLISSAGWRGALLMLALACLLLATPVMFLCIVKSPADLGLHPDGDAHRAGNADSTAEIDINFFGDWRFWLAGLSLACMPSVLMTFNTHIVSWAEHLQYGRSFGVTVLSGTAVVVALSALLCGQICDRLGAINTLRLALALELVGWAIINSADNQGAFLTGVFLLGLGAGSFMPCQAGLLAQLWPVQVFGRATGFVGLLVITVVFIVPSAVGWGYEHTAGYEQPMRWLFIVLIIPILLLSLLQRGLRSTPAPQASL